MYFRIDYIKATELLDRLPTVHEPDLPNAVECVFYLPSFSLHHSRDYSFFLSRSLSTYLDNLGAEYFNELLIRRLFVPFLFPCSSTQSKLIAKIIMFQKILKRSVFLLLGDRDYDIHHISIRMDNRK